MLNSDNINPITLREFRRLRRKGEFVVLFGIACILSGVFFFATLFLSGNIEAIIACIADFVGFVLTLSLGLFLSIIEPGRAFTAHRLLDEQLDAVPLPPKTMVHGYLATSLFWIPLVFLFLIPSYFNIKRDFADFTLSAVVREYPVWTVMMLVLGSLSGAAYVFSFVPRASNKVEGGSAFILPWLASSLIVFPCICLNTIGIRPFDYDSFVLTWVFYPGAVLCVGLTGYGLSRYHFDQRGESFRRLMFVNFVAYSLLGLFFGMVVFLVSL